MLELLLKSIVIGVAVAAPVGPVGLLCIQASLSRGWLAGSLTGLGAAFGDGVLAAVAVFGLAVAMPWLEAHRTAVTLCGALVVLIIGAVLILRRPRETTPGAPSLASHAGVVVSTFMLTVSNPMTILGFIGIFAGLGVAVRQDGPEPGLLIGGVVAGSMLWWAALSALVSIGHGRIGPSARRRINIGSGLLMIALALFALSREALIFAF